jgi:Crp-like helix-turn-helix domain
MKTSPRTLEQFDPYSRDRTVSDSHLLNQSIAQKHYFDRGKVLPMLETGYWQIRSGFVRTISWDVDKHISTLGLWSVDALISQQLTNLTPCRVECLSVVLAEKVISPVNLVNILMQQYSQVEELLYINHCRDLEQRLIKLLQWIAGRYSSTMVDGSVCISLRLSHRIIAELINTTRVTVTRLMNRLEHQGFLRCLPKQQVILLQQPQPHKLS